MLCACSIAGLVLDEFIVDNSNAVTREYGQYLAVALAFGNHPDRRGSRHSYLVGDIAPFAACSMIATTACGCET